VLWRSVIDVPRSRIQHSDVSQGPLERRFGLATFSVYTAGMRHAGVRLHGLAHDRALALRELLMQADDDDVI
jgi:membrane protein YdbS with pleckstrin-like domain